MKKINFKKDLKKMAIAGIASGTILLAQTAGAAETPTITDTHMAAGCAGGCGGKSPSYRPQAGCNGQKPATTQNYPRSNPQIAENDIFGRETDRYTPSNGSNSTNPNARNGYENKTQSYPKQPSHSCGGSGCHAKQNVQRGSAQGQNQSANPANQPSQRSVADNPSYPSSHGCASYPQAQRSAGCGAQHRAACSSYPQARPRAAGCGSYQQAPKAACASKSRGASCGGSSRSSGHGCA